MSEYHMHADCKVLEEASLFETFWILKKYSRARSGTSKLTKDAQQKSTKRGKGLRFRNT
jgi:hypothetical protein